jgi:hypothetical protein
VSAAARDESVSGGNRLTFRNRAEVADRGEGNEFQIPHVDLFAEVNHVRGVSSGKFASRNRFTEQGLTINGFLGDVEFVPSEGSVSSVGSRRITETG